MKDVEVYRFLTRVQQKLKAKTGGDAVGFIWPGKWDDFLGRFRECRRKDIWQYIKNAVSDFIFEKGAEKIITVVDKPKIINVPPDVLEEYFKMVRGKLTRWERFKVWIWLHFSKEW